MIYSPNFNDNEVYTMPLFGVTPYGILQEYIEGTVKTDSLKVFVTYIDINRGDRKSNSIEDKLRCDGSEDRDTIIFLWKGKLTNSTIGLIVDKYDGKAIETIQHLMSERVDTI